MKTLLKKYLGLVFSIYLVSLFIPVFKIKGGAWEYFGAALVLFLIIYIFKPVLSIILFPLNVITFNFFNWVINIILIYIWTLLIPEVIISPWKFKGLITGPLHFSPYAFNEWQTVLIVCISLVSAIRFVNWIVK